MKIWDYSLLPQQIAEAQSQPFPLHWLSQMQYTKQRHSFLNLQTKPEGPKKQRKKQDKEKPDQPIYNNNQSRGEKTIYKHSISPNRNTLYGEKIIFFWFPIGILLRR